MDEKANKNGILLPESLVRMPFCIPALGICVDFQKCVDFWFRLKKCVDLRRFICFVGLYQSRQGFFVDGDVSLAGKVGVAEQQVGHQVDDVPAGEVRPGLLAEGLGEAAHQILEDVAAVHRADPVGTEVSLGAAELLNGEIERVALHHAPDNGVEIELRKHVLYVGGEPGEVVAEVGLDVLRIGQQLVKGELARIVKLVAGGAREETVDHGQALHAFVGVLHRLPGGQQAVVKALNDRHRQDDEAVLVRLERAPKHVRHVPDHGRFFRYVGAYGTDSVIGHSATRFLM